MKTLKGLTLIEVLVTLVITSIGLMGLVSLQMQALKATQDTGNRSQAMWVFNDLVNRIRANETVSASYITNGNVDCGAQPAAICSNYNDGNATTNAANCTTAQLAAWDVFEVACGAPRNVSVRGNPIADLPGAALNITCLNAGCGNGDPLVVTLTWRARTDINEITGSAQRNATANLLTISETITP